MVYSWGCVCCCFIRGDKREWCKINSFHFHTHWEKQLPLSFNGSPVRLEKSIKSESIMRKGKNKTTSGVFSAVHREQGQRRGKVHITSPVQLGGGGSPWVLSQVGADCTAVLWPHGVHLLLFSDTCTPPPLPWTYTAHRLTLLATGSTCSYSHWGTDGGVRGGGKEK